MIKRLQSISSILSLFLMSCALSLQPAQTAAQIFYSANNEIRVIPVGSVESEFLIDADAYGISVDLKGEFIYWSESSAFGSAIKRAGLNGSGITTINEQSDATRGLRLDLVNEKIYWVDLTNDGEILRADLNGENTEVLIAGEPDGVTDGVLDLSLDLENEKIYWVKLGGVMRSNLDGSNVEVVVEVPSFVQPTSVEVNPRDGYVYWVDTSNDNIMRADTQTGEATTLINADEPSGISIEIDNNKMYWLDEFFTQATGQLNIANLDGSGKEIIMETGATRGAIAGFDWEISTSTETGKEQPSKLQLSQNFPNPFNPRTVVEYYLPETMEVNLTVFNAVGQQVAVLAKNSLQKTGTHRITFDASFLPSGIYFYQLKAETFSLTRKMTLLK